MSNVSFNVPKLKNKKVWIDDRKKYTGGYGWRGDRRLTDIKKIVIHHTVTNPQKDGRKEVDYIYKLHRNYRKWGGIGYHFVVSSEEKNGYAKVHMVGDIGSVRAHAANYKGAHGIPKRLGNVYTLGISIVGRFDQGKLPSPAQLRSAHELVNELVFKENRRIPKLKDWHDMVPHKELDSTSCPGDWGRLKLLIRKPPERSNTKMKNWKKKYKNIEKRYKKLKNNCDEVKSKRDEYKKKYKTTTKEVKTLKRVLETRNNTVKKKDKKITNQAKRINVLTEKLQKCRKKDSLEEGDFNLLKWIYEKIFGKIRN